MAEKIFEWKRLNRCQCGVLKLKIKMLMFANIILVGISDSYFLSVNGSIFFNNALICYIMILFGFYGLASSASVVIGGMLCQETSGHGRKPDEPHNFVAPEKLMERVHVSSTTGLPAEPNGLTTPEELIERVHVSSTGIHQRKRSTSTLHKWSCVSPPDPMVNSCCYHFDGKHVCVPKVFWTPANPYTTHFYLDSGAAFHMTGNQFILQAYPDHLNIMLPTQSVSGIDGSPLPVRRCGFINTTSIRLDGILYVEGLVANLVSVGQLAKLYSVRIVIEENLFTIEKIQTGEKIGQGHREGNHYVLDHFLPKHLYVENQACFV